MACHEIAALRLGLMKILGTNDEAEKAHELAELGDAAHAPGPIASLATAGDLDALTTLFSTSLVDLTKKVELELRAQVEGLARMNRELEEMHDLVHELFPVE